MITLNICFSFLLLDMVCSGVLWPSGGSLALWGILISLVDVSGVFFWVSAVLVESFETKWT